MAVQGGDVGERVEVLLAQLRQQGGERAASVGDELVRTLVEFYGEGLEQIVDIITADGPDMLFALAEDPLVESQLILHGLHPRTVDERIETALDRVRPYLGSHAGGVAYLGVDEHGVAHLRLDGSCSNCSSSTITVKLTIEEALMAAAPEVVGIEVDGQAEPAAPLLQIGLRPGATAAPPAPVGAPVWLHPSSNQLPADGFATRVRLDGRHVLMCKLAQTYYAYEQNCAACGESLLGPDGATTVLEGDVLTCVSCGGRFDVRLAGRAADRSGRRLNPLPLLDDVSGIRIAMVPETVAV